MKQTQKSNKHESELASTQSNGPQSIHRALSVLRTVSKYSEKGARLSEIAIKVELHVSTVRRILLVLCTEGFATFDPVSKLYHLGSEIYSLCSIPQFFSLRNSYRLALEHIANKTEDTVFLFVRSGNDTLCIDRVDGHTTIRIIYDIGMRRPMGLGASGLAILACLPDVEVERILAANKLRYLQHNNLSVERVRDLVKIARELGFSLNKDNVQNGVTGVGISIGTEENDPIGAISVASTSERMTQKRCAEISQIIESEITITEGL